jgi:threonyl-tRNA synthetase
MDDLDHRSLGTRLDLWHIQEDAPGMVFWHPRGHTLYRVLEDYIRRKMRRLAMPRSELPSFCRESYGFRAAIGRGSVHTCSILPMANV